MSKLGELFGWLLVWFYAATILNYIIKAVNKRFGKELAKKPRTKQAMMVLMKIFVRNHKFFGLGTVVLLLAHFVIQFSRMGFNPTGAVAAGLMMLQVLLGIYGSTGNRKRQGTWFLLHRIVAVLIVFGVAVHVLLPGFYKGVQTGGAAEYESAEQAEDSKDRDSEDSDLTGLSSEDTDSEDTGSDSKDSTSEGRSLEDSDSKDTNSEDSVATAAQPEQQTFTLQELAKYNGEDGQPAYVAYKGIVYEVTDVEAWQKGKHNGQTAGTDLTDQISKSPHGDKVFENLPMVGAME